MVDLPFEIIIEILSFSSVKSLLRFRCLSKRWCQLIQTPYFVQIHLSRSKQNHNNNLTIILENLNHHPNSPNLYFLKTSLSLILQNTITPYSLLTPIVFSSDYWVLGSCNGLLLLEHRFEDAVVLFNPSTRQHRYVPAFPIEYDVYGNKLNQYYGLGYDLVNDDYKIVRLVEDVDAMLDAKFYSLKSNLWQNIAYSDYFINVTCSSTWRAQINGAIHMIVTECSGRCWSHHILAFDIANANFYFVPTPDFMEKDVRMSVDVSGGCFYLIGYYRDYIDVCVMKVYGVKESWTKLFSISISKDQYAFVYLLDYSKTSDGVLLNFNNGDKFIWYDLKRKQIKNVGVSYLPKMLFTEVYVESLVLLDD